MGLILHRDARQLIHTIYNLDMSQHVMSQQVDQYPGGKLYLLHFCTPSLIMNMICLIEETCVEE